MCLTVDVKCKVVSTRQEGILECALGYVAMPLSLRSGLSHLSRTPSQSFVTRGTGLDINPGRHSGQGAPDRDGGRTWMIATSLKRPDLRMRRSPGTVRGLSPGFRSLCGSTAPCWRSTYFAQKYGPRLGKRIPSVLPATLEGLADYQWPGNVRELENVVERALILNEGPHLDVGAWFPRPSTAPRERDTQTLEEVEREHILAVLEGTGWRVSGEGGAAGLLGMKPTTLEARMKKLGITRPKSS